MSKNVESERRPCEHDVAAANQEPLHAVALAALVIALFGTYWDDAWHTDIGRDTFWSPPHILLYAGIGIAGAVIGLRAMLAASQTRKIRAIIDEPGLRLSLVGAMATLGSAPIDEVWHTLYGRDAVAWSPPHMLGLIGVLLIVGGLHLDLQDAKSTPGRAARLVSQAALLAVLLALVFEYDSDVPQFDELWYLPVMTFGLALGFTLIHEHARSTFAATKAALVYSALMALTIGILELLHHSTPILPLVAIPALVYDLVRRQGWTLPLRVTALVLTVFLVYQPYLAALPGVRLDAADTLIGLPLAALGAILAEIAVAWKPQARIYRAATIVVLLLVALPIATAHDPGQGTRVAPVELVAERNADHWTIRATVESNNCQGIHSDKLVARRAGREIEGHLEESGPCTYRGEIELPETGRWFAYVQLADAEGPLEAWIPLEPAEEDARKTTDFYRPPSTAARSSQVIPGLALYAASLALVALLVRAHRAAARRA